MGTLVQYPIVLDLQNRQFHEDIGRLGFPLAQPLPPPSPTDLQKLRNDPIRNDKYLEQVSGILLKYFINMEEKIPHMFKRAIGTTTVRFWGRVELVPVARFEQLQSNKQTQSKDEARMSYSKEAKEVGHSPIKTVEDALSYFNFAELHSSRLIELISAAESTTDLCEELDKWRKLKDNLIKFSKVVNNILQKYKHQTLKCPKVNELQKIKGKVVKAISGISIEKFHHFLGQKKLNFSADELFISALGLNGEVAKKLAMIPKDARCHQTDLYHLKDIVCQEVEEQCRKFDPENQICHILTASGFTLPRAELLAEDFQCHDFFKHQPLEYFVSWFFDFMFQYDIFLNMHCPRFPHQEDRVDEWLEVETTRYIETDDGEKDLIFYIPIYNSLCFDVETIMRGGKPFFPIEVKEGVWYHATDHSSAESIQQDGIDLSQGCSKQDFSDGNGFYLTPDLNIALKWAKRKGFRGKGAIIMFKYKIDGNSYKGLDLSLESEQLWSDVVKYYRSGKNSKFSKISRQVVNRLKNADFMEGPMSSDNSQCFNHHWVPTRKAGADSMQLCIKSQKLADDLSHYIEGIVYVSANKTETGWEKLEED